MINSELRLLICTNGSALTQPALEYGVWLSELLSIPATLLGIIERPEDRTSVEELIGLSEEQLRERDLAFQTRFEYGNSRQVITQITRAGVYISVVGPLGRPALKRFVHGRSFRRLMAKVETPIVYVPRVRLPLRKALLCMGGLEPIRGAEHLAVLLCQKAQAEITLLHVVEPITLDYPTAREVRLKWESILDTDTPQGRNMKLALNEIKEAGIKAEFKVRHGNPVHEIMDEICNAAYDLVVMGSTYRAHNLRRLYLPNVTAEVAESIDRPVITMRKSRSPDVIDPHLQGHEK